MPKCDVLNAEDIEIKKNFQVIFRYINHLGKIIKDKYKRPK